MTKFDWKEQGEPQQQWIHDEMKQHRQIHDDNGSRTDTKLQWKQSHNEDGSIAVALTLAEEDYFLVASNLKKCTSRKQFWETRHSMYHNIRRRYSDKWVCEGFARGWSHEIILRVLQIRVLTTHLTFVFEKQMLTNIKQL